MSLEEDEFGFEECDLESSQILNTTSIDYDPSRYRVIKSLEVMNRCLDEVQKVKAVIESLNETKIRLLLNDYRWDVEKFLEKYYTDESFAQSLIEEDPKDKENKPEVVQITVSKQASNLQSPNRRLTRSLTRKREAPGQFSLQECDEPPNRRRKIQSSALTTSSQNISQQKTEEIVVASPLCEICFDPIVKKLYTWKCGHKFCGDCFKSYLIERITCNSLNATFHCPGFKCTTILRDVIILKVLDKDEKSKFMRVITNQYIECNRMLRWCPGKKCTHAIEVYDTIKQPAVSCICGKKFCFSCGHFAHDLIPCDMIKKFQIMRANDYASASWIASHCKQCPKCKVEIDKNGGCNHMTCGKCRFEFCWICNGEWRAHINGTFACPGASIDQTNAKISSRRLVAAVSKYGSTISSIKKDQAIYKKYIQVQEKKAAEETDVWYHVDFVKEATDWIIKCRHLLCDSYVLEYFVEDEANTHWLSLAMSQRELMQKTEALSKWIENDITAENVHTMKQKLQTSVTCCKSLYNAVYEKAKEGFDGDLWKKVN